MMGEAVPMDQGDTLDDGHLVPTSPERETSSHDYSTARVIEAAQTN